MTETENDIVILSEAKDLTEKHCSKRFFGLRPQNDVVILSEAKDLAEKHCSKRFFGLRPQNDGNRE